MPRLTATRLSVAAQPAEADPRFIGLPAATAAWLQAVESRDGQQLEPAVFSAMADFANYRIPLGGACCTPTGPRTIAGALTAMVGADMTGVNLVSGDYNRRRILLDGNTKYIRTNTSGSDRAQNDRHVFVSLDNSFVPGAGVTRVFFGGGGGASNDVMYTLSNGNLRIGCSGAALATSHPNYTNGSYNMPSGGIGVFRNNSANFQSMVGGGVNTTTTASVSPASNDFNIGSDSLGGANIAAPVAVISVGPWIDPDELNAAAETLNAAILAELP